MQIRCSTCTKTIAIAPTGVLPVTCPHCERQPVPAQLGDYRLDRLLATGGMGEVYLAHHTELGTEVAIKLLPALPLDAIDAVRERFAREARLTAKVEHRGVVRVINSDAHGDRPYLVLELVTGRTLRDVVREAAVSPGQAARIVADTADVLAAAHQQGVLHRDIKPDNVMLEPDGSVRVLDFGIARAIADDAPLTRTGEIVGTPEYMAPEQLLDGPEATDARTDVHGLGVLLYELLTGKSPYRSANVFQSLKLVESLVPKVPAADNVPDALAAVAMRALQKQPEDRFATALELADAIRTAMPELHTQPSHVPTNKWPVRLAMTGCLLGALALTIAIWSAQNQEGDNNSKTFIYDGPSIAAPTDDIPATQKELQLLLHAGSWSEALLQAEAALSKGEVGEGDSDAKQTAQLAFALSHAAWLRAAGLPSWLAAYDMHRRERLFGNLLEPGDDSNQQLRELLVGDDDAWQTFAASETAPPMLSALLVLPAQPLTEKLQSLQTLAQRLPITEPEHWLARTIERHLKNDATGATQAAEMAWLHGAGELAVLLEAALAMPAADHTQIGLLWQRVARSDKTDSPASTLLLMRLEARGAANVKFQPEVAHTFPLVHQPAAARWFVNEAKGADAYQIYRLLCTAAALRAEPKFDTAPWRRVPPPQQPLLEKEYRRAQ